MQPKVWMTAIFFEKWISHFITFIQARKNNLNTTNYHLFSFRWPQFTCYYECCV